MNLTSASSVLVNRFAREYLNVACIQKRYVGGEQVNALTFELVSPSKMGKGIGPV